MTTAAPTRRGLRFHKSGRLIEICTFDSIMRKLDALFLSDLEFVQLFARGPKQRTKDGYFRCPVSTFACPPADSGWCNWTPQEQHIRIRNLRRKGYIKTIRRGHGGVRWVKINYDALERDIKTKIEEMRNK